MIENVLVLVCIRMKMCTDDVNTMNMNFFLKYKFLVIYSQD